MPWTTGTRQLNIFSICLLVILILGIQSGCGTTHNMSAPVRPTAVEQFLMTQAVERSLNGETTMPIPLAHGDTVSLDTSGLTVEQGFFKGAVGAWLGEKGLQVVPDSYYARYRIQILVQAFGTEQSISLLGLPQVETSLFPIALPEIALYKAQNQSGYTRFRFDIYETTTGTFIRSTPWFQGSTYFNEYTLLFFFDWHTTDLIGPF